MGINVYRNESLVQVETYETDLSRADELVNAVRSKWAFLREKGYAGDYPIEILRSGGMNVKVLEVFRWRSVQDQRRAQQDHDYVRVNEQIGEMLTNQPSRENFTQAVRGFNQNFPSIGGVELLRGVCSCLVSIDGVVKDYQMAVKNGIVLMHRSPQMDLDGDGNNEMYLKILMHGGDSPHAALGPFRVEQNFSRPNDGIVRSQGGSNDFPATAIWRVAWRIVTSVGPLLTDPDTPLIFGPAVVNHYPPVGTHFHSPTGPVALIHEQTGQRLGTLTPGELTAFDIVTTKDDEIYADILNTPPADLFEILDAHIPHMKEYAARKVEIEAAYVPA